MKLLVSRAYLRLKIISEHDCVHGILQAELATTIVMMGTVHDLFHFPKTIVVDWRVFGENQWAANGKIEKWKSIRNGHLEWMALTQQISSDHPYLGPWYRSMFRKCIAKVRRSADRWNHFVRWEDWPVPGPAIFACPDARSMASSLSKYLRSSLAALVCLTLAVLEWKPFDPELGCGQQLPSMRTWPFAIRRSPSLFCRERKSI